MTVLIVDDEPTMKRLFQQRFRKELEKGTLELTFATSGFQALEIISQKNKNLALILTDMSMPGMTGVELLKQARLQGCTCPIYIISAYDAESLVKYGISASWFLPKPLNFEKIKQIFSEI